MLLAANLSGMMLQIGAIINQSEKWLSIGIHCFSEINTLLLLRIFMCWQQAVWTT